MSLPPKMRNNDPWQKETPPQDEEPPPGRVFRWLALLAALAGSLWLLAGAFPGRLSSEVDYAYFLRLLVILVVACAAIAFTRRAPIRETLRNVLLWSAVIAVLVLGYSFQDELRFVGQRVRSEFIPGYAVATGANELVLVAQEDGHFYVAGEANGTRVLFLVDTGATETVLTPTDAMRLGIPLDALDFSNVYETANGRGRGADFTLDHIGVGTIGFNDFPVSINQAEMGTSLLGMSFLSRLASFEIRERRLYLRSN